MFSTANTNSSFYSCTKTHLYHLYKFDSHPKKKQNTKQWNKYFWTQVTCESGEKCLKSLSLPCSHNHPGSSGPWPGFQCWFYCGSATKTTTEITTSNEIVNTTPNNIIHKNATSKPPIQNKQFHHICTCYLYFLSQSSKSVLQIR